MNALTTHDCGVGFTLPRKVRIIHTLGVVAFGLATVPAAAGPVTFQDVTVAAGVDYLHWDGIIPQELPDTSTQVLLFTGGATAADFDGDGWCDLFVTCLNSPNKLFRNLQNGTFQETTVAAGLDLTAFSSGTAWGDVNNDGFPDLYVLTANMEGRNYLYINDGSGVFSEEAASRGVDQNTDGINHRRYTSAAFGDHDLDGDLDLFVSEWAVFPSRNLLFENDGTGHFTDVTVAAGIAGELFGFSPAFADMDNDDWPELVLAADFHSSRLFQNLKNGQFANVTIPAGVGTDENGMGSAIADRDNDGDLDWFVTSIYDTPPPAGWDISGNRYYQNEGNLLFTDQTDAFDVRNGDWGWGTSHLDYDNDGDLDLGMTNGIVFSSTPNEDDFNTDVVRFWRNDGPGAMTEIGASIGFTDNRSGKALFTFDYDRDGDEDIFIANNAEHPVLYRNDGGNSNDWLQVSLRGSWTNHFGIGARIYVEIVDGGTVQMREVNANSNYMSQNDVIAHFGLGSVTGAIHSVRVYWPASGLSQTLSSVAPNQRIQIQEPASLKGDINLDAAANGADIAGMVQILLTGAAPKPVQQWAADINDDAVVDSLDVPLLIDILFQP